MPLRITETTSGLQVELDGRRFYSAMPRAGAEKRAHAVTIKPYSLLLVASPLLCYGLDILAARCGLHSHILCVELEPELAALARTHYPTHYPAAVHKNITWLVGIDNAGRESALAQFDISSFRRITLVSLSGGFALHAGAYRTLQQGLERRLRTQWQNSLTLTHIGRLWIRNLLRNTMQLAGRRDVSQLRSDLPIVVAAAGESLDGSLELIGRLRQYLCIVAVDTALPALNMAGIDPDLVVALDAQQANLSDFLGQSVDNCRLACDLTTCPTILRWAAPQRTYLFLSRFAENGLLRSLEQADLMPSPLPPLGSVGVVAVHLALRITSAPVLITGLDFSYRIGKTHARGTPYNTRLALRIGRLNPDPASLVCLGRPTIRVQDKNNAPTLTELPLLSYTEQLRAQSEQSTQVKARLYDIGNSGLPLGIARLQEEAITKMLAGYSTARNRLYDLPPTRLSVGSTNPAVAEDFLGTLADELTHTIELLETVVTRGQTDSDTSLHRQEALRACAQLDWLRIDFSARAPARSEAAELELLLVSARDFRRRVRGLVVRASEHC